MAQVMEPVGGQRQESEGANGELQQVLTEVSNVERFLLPPSLHRIYSLNMRIIDKYEKQQSVYKKCNTVSDSETEMILLSLHRWKFRLTSSTDKAA